MSEAKNNKIGIRPAWDDDSDWSIPTFTFAPIIPTAKDKLVMARAALARIAKQRDGWCLNFDDDPYLLNPAVGNPSPVEDFAEDVLRLIGDE